MYFWQKASEKRDAAQILLNEIRAAEKAITEIQNYGITEMTFVLPVNSWEKYQHLFVGDFDEDELNLINDFYKSCIVIDKNVRIEQNSLPLNHHAKIDAFHFKLADLAEKNNNPEAFQKAKIEFEDIYFPERSIFTMYYFRDVIARHLPLIKLITTSTYGAKLKKLAKRD